MLTTLIIFVVILGVLVFIHELGHFMTARLFGVKVEEFGFGFPPRIIGWRRGLTVYSLNWIPFGGFVKLKGEQPGSSAEPDSFSAQSTLRRSVILSAGVLMNIILAGALLSFVFARGIPSIVDPQSIEPGGRISESHVRVVGVLEATPAESAGLKSGDLLLELDGQTINQTDDVNKITDWLGDRPAQLKFERGTAVETVEVQAKILDDTADYKLGVSIIDYGFVAYPWYQSLWLGVKYSGVVLGQIFVSLFDLVRNIFTQGRVSADLSGPIGIAVVTGQVADLGFVYLVQFAALLSLSLAAMNILPIPALDGGRLLFVTIEKIRGRPVSQKIEGLVHSIGFYLLLILIAVVSYRDVIKFNIDQSVRDFVQRITT